MLYNEYEVRAAVSVPPPVPVPYLPIVSSSGSHSRLVGFLTLILLLLLLLLLLFLLQLIVRPIHPWFASFPAGFLLYSNIHACSPPLFIAPLGVSLQRMKQGMGGRGGSYRCSKKECVRGRINMECRKVAFDILEGIEREYSLRERKLSGDRWQAGRLTNMQGTKRQAVVSTSSSIDRRIVSVWGRKSRPQSSAISLSSCQTYQTDQTQTQSSVQGRVCLSSSPLSNSNYS